MGRGKGGSTSHGKRTPGGIRTSSKMSKVGEIEAKHGVQGEERETVDALNSTDFVHDLGDNVKTKKVILPNRIEMMSKHEPTIDYENGTVDFSGKVPSGEDGYLYHSTFAQNVDPIKQEGLIPNKSNNWEDWSEKGYSYFAKSPEGALQWAKDLYEEQLRDTGDVSELDDIAILKVKLDDSGSSQTGVRNDAETKKALFQDRVADYDKDKRVQLGEFWNKYQKRLKAGDQIDEPDIAVLNNDIDRALLALKRKEPGVKSLEKYKSHVELHDAMKDYRTKAEAEKEGAQKALEGVTLVSKKGDYKVLDVTNPDALMTMANDTHWCTKEADRAKKYLNSWDYRIITKDGVPIAAMKKFKTAEGLSEDMDPDARDSILSRADDELIDGYLRQNWNGTKNVVLPEDDYNIINQAASDFGIKGLDSRIKKINPSNIEKIANDVITRMEADDYGASEDYIALIGVLTKRLSPELESRLVNSNISTEMIAQYAKSVGRVDAIEKASEDNPQLAVDYSAMLSKRYPGDNREAVEQGILDAGGRMVVEYAEALQGRFKPGEEVVAKDAKAALIYTRLFGKDKRFPGKYRELAEKTIMQNPRIAGEYAVLQDERNEEFEKQIINNGDMNVVRYIKKFIHGRWKEAELGIIAKAVEIKDPSLALSYAKEYVKEKWEPLETVLAASGTQFQKGSYATEVAKQRWLEQEDKILEPSSAMGFRSAMGYLNGLMANNIDGVDEVFGKIVAELDKYSDPSIRGNIKDEAVGTALILRRLVDRGRLPGLYNDKLQHLINQEQQQEDDG